MLLTQGVVNPSDHRRLEPSTSPGVVSETCPPSSSSRNSSRLAGVSAPTFIENSDHVNAPSSQYGESMEE